MGVHDVLHGVFRRFGELGLRYAVGGSFASSVWGVPRQTNDLDVLLELPQEKIGDLCSSFEDEFNLSRTEIEDAVTSRDPQRSFQLLHFEEIFKIDVFLGHDRELTQTELDRRQVEELVPGLTAPCLTSEDVLLEKLRWFELGNRVSDRQWNDIVGVIEVQGPALDRTYLLKWAERLGVRELAENALSEAKGN